MKNYTALFILSFVFLYNCTREEPQVVKHGSISFSLTQKGNKGGRIESSSLPKAVILSIKDSKGSFVYENKKLNLLTFGSGYLSESLQLSVGSFTLTQSIVLDSADRAIYATPVEGSDLAKYVKDALPINFTIAENLSTTLFPEVIAVDATDTPERFGYVSFGFIVVDVPSQLDTLYRFIFNSGCNCFIPTGKSIFTYDANNRIVTADTYGFYTNDGFIQTYHDTLEYFNDHIKTTSSLVASEQYSVTEVYFDAASNIASVKLYDDQGTGLTLTGTRQYTYNTSGYVVEYLVKDATSGGAKVAYGTNDGNVIHTTNFDVNGNNSGEADFTYGTLKNPMHDFYALLYTYSESSNNLLKKTAGSYEEDYKYTVSPQGQIMEMEMMANNGTGVKYVYKYH